MKKTVILFAALMLSVPAVGSSVSAASSYETNVEYGVNFRTGPGTGYKVIRMLPRGEDIHVIEKVNRYWLKIETKDGKIGYISADPKYTDYAGGSSAPSTPSKPAAETPSSSKADAIIATAKSLIGKAEYDYGTRDPKRLIFDCSSFTQYVFEKHGIKLKWGTRYQKNAGTYVSKSNLQKGDLVFFSVGSSSSIGHVGIYIGNGDFIHILDKSVSDVHISNLNSGYWKDHYVTARRVL
jgi:cell wall-associated NlpC family hydrolase